MKRLVDDLQKYGFGYMPIDPELLLDAYSALEGLTAAGQACEWAGEASKPFGLVKQRSFQPISFPGLNTALRFVPQLSKNASTDPHTRACLGMVARLHRTLQDKVEELTNCLAKYHEVSSLPPTVRQSFVSCDDGASDLWLSARDRKMLPGILKVYLLVERGGIEVYCNDSESWRKVTIPRGTSLVLLDSLASEYGMNPTKYRTTGGDDVLVSHLNVRRKESPVVSSQSDVVPIRKSAL